MDLRSELDPWRVICAKLFELSSHDIPEVIERTGLVVDWSLSERENYSHTYRKAAYRPRINSAYEHLQEHDRLRVVNITASELANRGKGDEMNSDLQKINWRIDSGHLVPANVEVSELFFPEGTQHDAYVQIRRIFQKATKLLTVIDPYIDSSLFTLLKTVADSSIEVELLTDKYPPDFILEARKFLSQHTKMRLSVKKSKTFHDRFIIVDGKECWHVGTSIKDAGLRVFMLNEIEDCGNRATLIAQLNNTRSAATHVTI